MRTGADTLHLLAAFALVIGFATAQSVNSRPPRVRGVLPESKLIRKVKPVYPQRALDARIEGIVRLNAIIDRDGHITRLRVASGHPLLCQAALDAVKQWIYSPTLVNGERAEVITVIDVPFTLPRQWSVTSSSATANGISSPSPSSGCRSSRQAA